MTTFSITGLRGDKRVTIAWTDGKITGDADAVATLQAMADALEGTVQGQFGGPYTVTDHLSSPYTACAMMKLLFERGTTTQTGKLPLLDIPDGAIH